MLSATFFHFIPKSAFRNPHFFLPLPSFYYAPIAQLDRAFDYESKGWEFESLWVHFLGAGKWNEECE